MNYSNSQFNQLGAAAATLSRFPKRTRIYKEPPLCRYNSFSSSSSSFLLDGRGVDNQKKRSCTHTHTHRNRRTPSDDARPILYYCPPLFNKVSSRPQVTRPSDRKRRRRRKSVGRTARTRICTAPKRKCTYSCRVVVVLLVGVSSELCCCCCWSARRRA